MLFSVPATILLIPALIALAFAAATDVEERRIPDEITAVVASIGLCLSLLIRPGSVLVSIFVAAATLGSLAFASRYRILGGGDVKLLSAVTLLVAPSQVGSLLFAIGVAGGALACTYLSARLGLVLLPAREIPPFAKRPHTLASALTEERARIANGSPLPYGVAIFAGVGYYAAHEITACFFAMSFWS